MSTNKNTKKHHAIHKIALIIVVSLVLFIPIFILFSEDINMVLGEVWEHLKTLSLIIISYLFGINKSK